MPLGSPTQRFRNFDPGDPALIALARCASRIAILLETPRVVANQRVEDCLDLLLGAAYSLVFAEQEGYEHRVSKRVEEDKVLVRARSLADGTVRTDGKWMAGFHLNGALFRESSVYDRILKVVSLKKELDMRRAEAEARYGWRAHSNIQAIHRQVNDLKHSTSGSYRGRRRDAGVQNSIDALHELLTLIEAWASQDLSPG